MRIEATARALALASVVVVAPALAADIVLTPPAGGAVIVTNAAGNTTRVRMDENGLVTVNGNLEIGNSTAGAGTIMRGGVPFLHDHYGIFLGELAGNFAATGSPNQAIGTFALHNLTSGNYNVAIGSQTLAADTTGSANVAVGSYAANVNSSGMNNVAIGDSALSFNTTGHNNIAIGKSAGISYTTGSGNIAIGHGGIGGEASTTRIGSTQTRTFISGIRGVTTGSANAIPVLIDSAGQLGTVSSSRAVKDDIADMDAASTALMKLRPVTFHYKSDSSRHLEYGLIAEEVAEVMPQLVAHSSDGRIETVMYQYLPPMLLNEYQKQQRTIARQGEEIAELKQMIGQLIAERKKP